MVVTVGVCAVYHPNAIQLLMMKHALTVPKVFVRMVNIHPLRVASKTHPLNTGHFFLEGTASYTENLMDVDKELFIWSVITGRRDFNLIFWTRGKNKICK